ncbi:MAG: [FeFe] hydrogenase H-cluster maturation GTPase HydF [Bdellovibrionales bacterium RIFOXYB1_FULL_37_110]|nr:MAG: [FeFe] hydrogenase H-cluster maturation GTPase HydF [Bdellovibrionales bacterium RIFOXYC1_FULL_37_79]OFZ58116.1 MAG: [FeFe] hydrogenase H-cluster maturation GTPase HydF [Bdellovibrionales bacterium RIFOXYB1_FULL_37_110]OFZ61805.1 MAG: [FeFe] hydrogenase H-cluster maturation GTPase HydF [Bdellovibrionales bacterium RIFOXYD1_FULL_36_51]
MLKSMRYHIGIFGLRNVGKSSFINLIGQQITSIVSSIPGTTTDPVKRFMEIPPIGPVVIIDTAGIDDQGVLGEKRIKSTMHALNSCDLSILICDQSGITKDHKIIITEFTKRKIPWFIVWNKSDLYSPSQTELETLINTYQVPVISLSTMTRDSIPLVIETITHLFSQSTNLDSSILGDLVQTGDLILLVTPIDQEAPKKRLIQPQVQTIRDALDNDCMVMMLKERELDTFFKKSNLMPKLVITDSQVFLKVAASVPRHIMLTSFSILFARLKTPFFKLVEGTRQIANLKDHDKILILESCSHHQAGDDIGTVKIPRWIRNFTGKNLSFDIKSGNDFLPEDTSQYQLVIQCGGCMLTKREVNTRLQPFFDQNIPVTNYGMCIAYTLGIFERTLECFNHLKLPSFEDYL